MGFHSVQLSKGSKWASSDSGSARALPHSAASSSRCNSFLTLRHLPYDAAASPHATAPPLSPHAPFSLSLIIIFLSEENIL